MAWPGTAKDARTVLQAMPKELGGAPGELSYSPGDPDEPGADAGIAYGEFGSVSVSEEYVSSDTEDGKPELLSANNLLSASFGLVYACARGSYRGTAPKPAYEGGGPGVTDRPLKRSVWFSCKIDGAEGDDDFTGFAVGWTSKKTAWLVVAEDDSAARQLVTALHEAAT